MYRHFDQGVRGDTVVYPGESDAVVLTPIEDSKVAVLTSIDSNLYGELDPFSSGAYAVAESIRNIISVGGTPIALTDCLNYGNPENPAVFHDFQEGVKGISEAANHLNIEEENNLRDYILDKLDIKKEEFDLILKKENKNFRNFKTYYNFFKYFKLPIKILYKINFIPKILYLRYFG